MLKGCNLQEKKLFVIYTNYVCFQTKVLFLAAMKKCGNKDLGQSCVQNEMQYK